MKALNGFLKTQRQVTLKDVCGYVRKLRTLYVGYVHVCRPLSYLILSIRFGYSLVEQHLRFCGVRCIARLVSQPR